MGKKKGNKGGQHQGGKKAAKGAPPGGRKINFQFSSSSRAPSAKAEDRPKGSGAKQNQKVSLSLSNEAELRLTISELWKTVENSDEATAFRKAQFSQTKSKLAEEIKTVYDEVSRLGFTKKQVEDGLTSILEDGVSKANVLDWLCLNFAADELPRKLASGAFSVASAGSVEVVSKGSRSDPGEDGESVGGVGAPFEEDSEQARLEEERRQREEEEKRKRAEEALRKEEEERARREREEALKKKKEEEAQNKDWIKRYMESAYDEEEEEEEEDFMMMGASPYSNNDAKGQWSMYSDPREVERRKRSRPEDPEQAIEEIAKELEAAKAEASTAKSEGNKQKQKEAGMMIKDLKDELKALGITDEAQLLQRTDPDQAEEGAEEAALGLDFEALEVAESVGGGEGEGKAEEKAEEESSDDGEAFGGAMFDEDAEDDYVPVQKLASEEKELSGEWLQETKKKVKHAKPQKDQPKKHEQLRMPKVLLQQHCQRSRLPNPKYEKVQAESAANYRYSVTVEVQIMSKGRKKKMEQKKFEVPEEEDIWSTIQDAQNAVAARALFYITNQQPLYRIIPSPFREMWVKWESEASAKDEAVQEEENLERDEFIDDLVTKIRNLGASRDGTRGSQNPRGSEGSNSNSRGGHSRHRRTPRRGPKNETLLQELEKREKTKKPGIVLPIMDIRETMPTALEDNDFLIVCGETGSGKTTQVPQLILDHQVRQKKGEETFVVCTQPRRIAAVSVAERVASERMEPPPGQRGSRVGYHVRLDASTTGDTKVLFCTTGILLRKLMGDPLLATVSHVVIDEVHERTVQSDLLLAMIRDIVHKRKAHDALGPLKLVLMSATIDTTLLSEYLHRCPVMSVGGRAFDVTQNYLEDIYEMVDYQLDQDNPASHRLRSANVNVLVGSQTKDKVIRANWGDDICSDEVLNPEYDPASFADYSSRTRRNLMRLNEEKIDYELIQTLLVHIDDTCEEGAVLVFLPGMAEINNLYDQLVSSYHFGKNAAKRDWILPLHSNISPEEQRGVFRNPPKGIRKFVLATNIAETSITIDDIVFVVDSGHVKERQYDASRGLGMLIEGWISGASAKQRKGRAGRVRPGVCYSLFTSDRARKMRAHPVPEIMRVPLEEVCLHIRKLQLGLCKDFLGRMVQPPHSHAIDAAVSALTNIGAISEDETLTPLGHHLAGLPVDCRIGKLLLLGTILGCLSSILTVAACLSYKTPFASSYEERDAADRCKAALCLEKTNTIASGQCSDHLAMVAAYNGWLETKRTKGAGAARTYARAQHLSQATLYMITDLRKQLVLMLRDIGFVRGESARGQAIDDPENKYNKFSGNPTFVKNCLCAALYPNVAMLGSDREWIGAGGDHLFCHPSSVNHGGERSAEVGTFIVFLEKIKTRRVYLHDTTVVSAYTLMLFCGGNFGILYERGVVEIDGWIRLRVPAQTAVLFKRMRQIIHGHLLQKLHSSASTDQHSEQLMASLSRLL